MCHKIGATQKPRNQQQDDCELPDRHVLYGGYFIIYKGDKVDTFNKLINKIFFKKVIFKIIVVLTFFLSLTIFVLLCRDYNNPYAQHPDKKYNNFVSFVYDRFKDDVIQNDIHEDSYKLYPSHYEHAFVKQAINKGIIVINSFNYSYFDYSYKKYNLIEPVLMCDTNKFVSFMNEYKFFRGENFPVGLNKDVAISVNCAKATTIPLTPESGFSYFFKHDLWIYLFASFVCVPLIILVLCATLRFIIISPILWIFHKD